MRRLEATPDDAMLALEIDNELDRMGRTRAQRKELHGFSRWKGGSKCNVRSSCMKDAVCFVSVMVIVTTKTVPVVRPGGVEVVEFSVPARYQYPSCSTHRDELALHARPPGREDKPDDYPGYGRVLTFATTPIERKDDPRASNVDHRPRDV